MSATKVCIKCKRRIISVAASCICGWREQVSQSAEPKPIWGGPTPYAEKCINEMRALLSNRPKPSKEWARKIMENPNSTDLRKYFAAPVYASIVSRVPGEDDE